MKHGGIRVIAALEAAKGILVLAAGAGLLALMHRDAQEVGEHILLQFHLNPASRYPRIFLDALHDVSDVRLLVLALGAAAYAAVRFVEAYGLWRQRRWAEWLAAAGAAIYIPFELYHLWLRVTGVKLALLALNIVIVAYMARVLWRRNAGTGSLNY